MLMFLNAGAVGWSAGGVSRTMHMPPPATRAAVRCSMAPCADYLADVEQGPPDSILGFAQVQHRAITQAPHLPLPRALRQDARWLARRPSARAPPRTKSTS